MFHRSPAKTHRHRPFRDTGSQSFPQSPYVGLEHLRIQPTLPAVPAPSPRQCLGPKVGSRSPAHSDTSSHQRFFSGDPYFHPRNFTLSECKEYLRVGGFGSENTIVSGDGKGGREFREGRGCPLVDCSCRWKSRAPWRGDCGAQPGQKGHSGSQGGILNRDSFMAAQGSPPGRLVLQSG